MQTAVHIGVVVLVVTAKCIEHRFRFLRGRSVVEVDQRLAVCLLMEDRKILTDSLPIDLCSSRLVHGLICPVPYRMPIYSGTPLQTPVQSHTAGGDSRGESEKLRFCFRPTASAACDREVPSDTDSICRYTQLIAHRYIRFPKRPDLGFLRSGSCFEMSDRSSSFDLEWLRMPRRLGRVCEHFP